jgi:putative ABC transport system substrate-binding protein
MALNRRQFLLTLPLCAGACAARHGPSSRDTYLELARTRVRGAHGTILVCMPETRQTREVWTGLADELAEDFGLVALKVESKHGAAVIRQAMQRHRPSAVVLMNNPTVLAYRDFQRSSPGMQFPPAVIVMTSFLEGRRQQLIGATGISYEVPLITAVTNLRKLLATPIERVGVVLRTPLRRFVRHESELARREQIAVRTEIVSATPNSSELRRALRRVKRGVDALWVLNDDRLLTPELIENGWLPGLRERRWLPTIVGAASLVSPQQSLGTFAVLPDHTALGVQAANLLFDIADNQWQVPAGTRVQLPLSTTTTVDLTQVRERFSLRRDALAQVDRILE